VPTHAKNSCWYSVFTLRRSFHFFSKNQVREMAPLQYRKLLARGEVHSNCVHSCPVLSRGASWQISLGQWHETRGAAVWQFLHNHLHLGVALNVSYQRLSSKQYLLACALVLLLRAAIPSCQKSNEAVGGKEHTWEFLERGSYSSFSPSAVTDYLD